MKITIERVQKFNDCTIGYMTVEGRNFITLEPPITDGKKGAIPAGTYQATLSYSPKFKTELPLLSGVPGRTTILIHPGNFPTDTQGCILVGKTLSQNQHKILDSRSAVSSIVRAMRQNGGKAEVHIR